MQRVRVTMINVSIMYEDLPRLMTFLKGRNYGIAQTDIVIVDQDHGVVIDPFMVGKSAVEDLQKDLVDSTGEDIEDLKANRNRLDLWDEPEL